MDNLLTIPAGVFLLLWGLLWEPAPMKRKKKKHRLGREPVSGSPEPESEAAPSDVKSLTPQQKRAYLRLILIRISLFALGTVGLAVGLVSDLHRIEDWGAFLVLSVVYAALLLLVQRVEKSRRLLALFFMGFAGLMTWRTAEFRGYPAENDWAVLAGVTANLVFWLIMGRRFPPGTSDSIEVYGME